MNTIATRHHTQQEQIRATCRVLAVTIEGFLEELDECPGTGRLKELADDLRRVGHEAAVAGARLQLVR